MQTRVCNNDSIYRGKDAAGVIRFEDWSAELDRSAPSPDAMTICQWSAKIRKPRQATSAWVRAGIDAGWMERATTTVEMLAGGRKTVVGFRVIKQKKNRRRA